MTVPPFIEELLVALGDVQITRYAQLASSCIIAYDHLITLDNEVELIWKSSWSAGKTLFIINRYYSLSSVIFNNFAFFSRTFTDSFLTNRRAGLRFFQWQGWTGLIACMIAEIILQMRLYALYSLNKKILICMGTAFVIASAASATIMGSVLSGITARAQPIPPRGQFCLPSGVSNKFFTFWIPMLSFECFLCGLALFRGFQTFMADGGLFRSGRHLVGILIRDSVLYFLVICATYLTCLIVWISARTTLLEVPIGFSLAMSCVLANRVILNVREVNRDLALSRALNTGQKPAAELANSVVQVQVSLARQGSLSDIEMAQLRTMRSTHNNESLFVIS